jgi:CRP-like cAMP-binding protein
MISFNEYLKNTLQLPEGLRQKFITICHPFTLKKRENLITTGDDCDKIYFLTHGILREYETYNDKFDKTTRFYQSGDWVLSVESYIDQKPSALNIQTVTITGGFFLHRSDIENLLSITPTLGFFMLKVYRNILLKLEKNNKLLRLGNGVNRLLLFREQNPELDKLVLDKHIASYLNLTASQFSRIGWAGGGINEYFPIEKLRFGN